MASLSVITFKGDPEELLRIKREKVDPVAMGIARRHGILAHVVTRSDDGLKLFSLWETNAGPEALKEIGAVGQDAGMPAPDHQVLEVADHTLVPAS